MKAKTVLITGSAGFLGSHLAEKYLSQGAVVVGVDNFLTGSPANVERLQKGPHKNFFFIEADISKPWTSWEDKARSVIGNKLDYLFHFASPASPIWYQKFPLETLRANSEGLEQALQFANNHSGRVIFASTSEVYGNPQVSPQSENYYGYVNSFGPRSCYDEAKRFGEALIYTYNDRYKNNHGILRIFNTYGPYMNLQDGRVIIDMLMRAQNRQELQVFGDGTQTRSFCYVDDLIAAIEIYAERSISEPMNIGNDTEITVLQLAKVIQDIFRDESPNIVFKQLPKDDPLKRRPDLTQARTKLSPWKPQVTLEEGLLKTLAWLREKQ